MRGQSSGSGPADHRRRASSMWVGVNVSGVNVCSAEVLPDLDRLEPLMRRIFGEGDRAPGWFSRKVQRECIDPALSRLAFEGDDPLDPRGWAGVVLVGTPPSLHPTARTAGIGVVSHVRGRGVGRALLCAVCSAVSATGLEGLQIPADASAVGFFERLGFQPVASSITLLARGRGAKASEVLGSPRPWSCTDPPRVTGWLAEAWNLTPARQRQTQLLLDGGLRLDVALEGRAWVVHRVVADAMLEDGALADALDQWLEGVPSSTVAMIAGADPVSSVTAELQRHGWAPVQRAVTMQRGCEDPPARRSAERR